MKSHITLLKTLARGAIFTKSSTRSLRFGVLTFVTAMAFAGAAQAAFIVYDTFGVNGAPDTNLWVVRGSAPFPSVSGGTVTLTNNTGMRSTGSFAIGSTLRIVVDSMSAGPYVFGANSQTTWWDGTAVDAMYVRNDGGYSFYAGGVGIGSASPGSTAPATFDFVFGASTLEIFRNTTLFDSIARPAPFTGAQQFDIGVYGGGSLVISGVSYQVVPEPGTIGLLGLAGMVVALLSHRAHARRHSRGI